MKNNKIFEKCFKTDFKKGWTMVELCVTMIALAILVGISIQSLKPKKFLIGPFAYAGVKNLRTANFGIIDKCNKNTGETYEVYGCEPNQGLPDAIAALPALQKEYDENPGTYTGGKPTESNMDDPYCFEVASTFTVIGDTINCKYKNGNNTDIKLPKEDGKGANAGVPNFQASNMVAYYHLESPWVKIVKGASTEGSEDSFNATDDPYCFEVASAFTVIGDTINCKYKNGNNTDIKLPSETNGHKGTPNFQASNMVAYYHLESPWVKIVKGASTEGSEDSFNATDDTDFYKQIFIDVNGNDKPNRIGEDQFPLRIYKLGGEIIPGFCGNGGVYTSEKHTEETSGNYKDRCATENMPLFGGALPNWQETNYPFSYNLYRSYSDEDNPDDRHSSRELLGVSYMEAACKGGRHNMIPREECDTYKNSNPDKYAKNTDLYNTEPEYGKYVLKNCTEGDVAAFCVVRIARPEMPGLFKLPIL